jgi:glutaredoxin
MAKEFLDERCIRYLEIILDEESGIESMKRETGARMFPFIFEEGEFIGGLKELMTMYDF